MEPNTIDKHCNMKQFIIAQKDYMKTKADDSANIMVRHLQLLSVTIDLSTFDPHTNIVAEFFVSMHQLLSVVESGSLLAWCSVNVLSAACKNSSARTALIHTYQFLPLLSRLLGNQLTMEKKLRLLTLMQELTCGIKISWQIPHLPHLMSTLTRWIQSGDEDVAALSLAVLVNLCYKNLPAIYTLSRCVDIKKFLHTCLPLQGVKIEVHVCKLLIILDYMNENIPENVILQLIEVTFKSLTEAFKAHDSLLLRHIVEFFLDVWDQKEHGKILMGYSNYDEEFQNVLVELESTAGIEYGDILAENEPECVSSVFEFIHFVIRLREPKIEFLNSRLVNIALKWLQVALVSSDALAILRTLAINITEETCIALNPFVINLPLFLMDIVNGDDAIPTHIKSNTRLTSLMELLRALLQAEYTKKQVVSVLKEELFAKIFSPLLGTTSQSDTNSYSIEATLLYVNAIVLIHQLKEYEEKWKIFFADLMQHKQIHAILAQALCCGNKEIKLLIMRIMVDDCFPTDSVAGAMCDIQPLIQENHNVMNNNTQHVADNLYFPAMSVTQIARLDEIIDKIKEAYERNDLVNVSTSDVMELYEYKLATISHAERAAISSVEAASLRCTHLQHRTAQLTAELSRLHQLLLHTQQCHEESARTTSTTLTRNKQLQELLDNEKAKFSSTLSQKEKVIHDQAVLIESINNRIKIIENEKFTLEQTHTNIQDALKNKMVNFEKLLKSKEEELLKRDGIIKALKTQILELEKLSKRSENELVTKNQEFAEVTKDLQNCKSILGTITQLTSSHYARKEET